MIDIKHIYSFIQIKTCPKNELIFSDIFPAIKLNKVLFVYTQTQYKENDRVGNQGSAGKGACYKIQKKLQLKEVAVYLTQFLSSIRFLEDTSTYIFACIEGIFSPFESTMAQEEGNKDFEVRNFWH